MTTGRNVWKFNYRGKVYDWGSRTHLMGILNVTPDSFSDGGKFFDHDMALARGEHLAQAGADILDIGGESTRPGSDPVPEQEEIRRVVPVIRALREKIDVPISIDTYKSAVARAALDAGAVIVNDISGLTYDPAMAEVIREFSAGVVLMHVLGKPKTMQDEPKYGDVVREVREFLAKQVGVAEQHGIEHIIIDPGIGFGKTIQHNLELINRLDQFASVGCPVLVGPSRKSFIGKILDLPSDDRVEGTAAAVTACILHGANLLRVHDVKEMKRVSMVADAIKRGGVLK